MRQWGTYLAFLTAVSKHTLLRLLNAESEMTILALSLIKALTAPILLPHTTIVYPFRPKYSTAVSTSLL
jgi:hypothetical protein